MKSLFAAHLLALATLLADFASADTVAGVLGADASASDYYQVTCSDDGSGLPASFSVQVSDEAPAAAPIVSVQVRAFRTGPTSYAARNSSDATDGDFASSLLAFVNLGAGTFEVFVDKTSAGVESYVVTFLCTTGADGTGVRTGTAITDSSVVVPPVPALGLAAQLALCALLLAGFARGAVAHEQGGSLGAGAGATDYYQVTCENDGSGPPASLSIEIVDEPPVASPLVSVQARRGTQVANATDATDGDGSPSPPAHVNGGEGVYDVLVDKTAAGAESYTLDFHCTTGANGSGLHTGTEIITRQNQ